MAAAGAPTLAGYVAPLMRTPRLIMPLAAARSRPSTACCVCWAVAPRWSLSSRRTLFLATIPRLRRPVKGATSAAGESGGKSEGKAKPAASSASSSAVQSSRPAPLPYRSASSSRSSQREEEQQQQQQQKSENGEEEQPLNSLLAQRRAPLIGAALAAGVLGFYIMPLLFTYLTGGCREDESHAGNEHVSSDAVPTGLPPMGSAAAFDASLDVPERVMGVMRLRKQLAEAARGAVLEVAVGTGRNAAYYRWAPLPGTGARLGHNADPMESTTVTSFTGVDLSEDALAIARRRLRTAVPGAHALSVLRTDKGALAPAALLDEAKRAVGAPPKEVVNVLDGQVRLFRADALKPLPAPAPAAAVATTTNPRYDTIVQTFGLCSVADPVALLANMAAVLRPETGRIVLLEHGRGRWPAVNALLDRYAGRHFARFGCWWNRDMDAILAAAQQAVPGLEVVAVRRPGWLQFGTLWWIELRVQDAAEATAKAKAATAA